MRSGRRSAMLRILVTGYDAAIPGAPVGDQSSSCAQGVSHALTKAAVWYWNW